MRSILIAFAALIASLCLVPSAALAQTAAPTADLQAACSKLPGKDFSRIADAPTQVTAAKWIAAGPDAPAHCQVIGYVSPAVGIELLLPAAWNGKFSHVGCGGMCGGTFGLAGCGGLLTHGYACIMSDLGHKSTALDAKWAYNNLQAKFDFGTRATHVSTLAGKAVTAAFYGANPKLAYYFGCSTGGRQGMFEAQRFPDDFDGIVAGAPVLNETGDAITLLWNTLSTLGPDGKQLFSFDDIRHLHSAVIAACDMNDGIKDGLIGDGRKCHFDPQTIVCKAGRTGDCLSDAQVAAVRRIYGGPRMSNGDPAFIGIALPGSELNWLKNYIGENGDPSIYYTFIGDFYRYIAFSPDPGPNWKPEDFDFDRDPQRLGVMEVIYNAQNPDLRRFKAHGGKLISYHGWADQSVMTQLSTDYYAAVNREMGGLDQTKDFFRLFMVPGMNHCTGGEGPWRVDYLSYIEDWVEKNKAPEMMLAQHPIDGTPAPRAYGSPPLDAAHTAFSRPLYPYPTAPRYVKGDKNSAASFAPAAPSSSQ